MRGGNFYVWNRIKRRIKSNGIKRYPVDEIKLQKNRNS